MRSNATIALAVLATAMLATAASAGLRSPQVHVNGTALQNFFNARHVPINASTDQLDQQTFSVPIPSPNGIAFSPLGPGAIANTYGIYNGSFATPPLYLVLPG